MECHHICPHWKNLIGFLWKNLLLPRLPEIKPSDAHGHTPTANATSACKIILFFNGYKKNTPAGVRVVQFSNLTNALYIPFPKTSDRFQQCDQSKNLLRWHRVRLRGRRVLYGCSRLRGKCSRHTAGRRRQ